jgi:hypothetical protein
MKFNYPKFSKGTTIFILGFCGLIFTLVDSFGEVGSKIPLALFFIFLMGFGILVELAPGEQTDDVFGEREPGSVA